MREARMEAAITVGIPAHISSAMNWLGPRPNERLLEVGCGSGVALGLICSVPREGHLVGIDRSATQIRLAGERNRVHVESGALTLHTMALETARLDGASFDRIFAINVNCFWLHYREPLNAVRRLLKPGGELALCYRAPTPVKAQQIIETLRQHLITSEFLILDELTSGFVLGVSARPIAGEQATREEN